MKQLVFLLEESSAKALLKHLFHGYSPACDFVVLPMKVKMI